jgi:hypothetical protein
LRRALRECVDQAFTDYEARRAGDNELRPQERSTQVIAGDRHKLKVFRAKGLMPGLPPAGVAVSS